MTDFSEIWSYLSRGPLLWLTATLAAYAIGDWCFRATGRQPLSNPVLIAVALLAGLLWASGTDYPTYFEGAQFVHFLLGPATVCLAVPLWENLPKVRKSAAVAFNASAPRALITRSTPASANACAQPRPKPLDAAQTSARLPLIPRSILRPPAAIAQ